MIVGGRFLLGESLWGDIYKRMFPLQSNDNDMSLLGKFIGKSISGLSFDCGG